MDARDQLGDSVGDRNWEIDRFPDGMRVLAVDDDVIYLKVLEASLRKCKYEVTTANDAKQALEILRENENKFDLVISDVQMPDMDGFQLLQHLRQEIDLPVIMVSSNGDNEFIKKGICYGACCYLVKPASIEVFKTIWQHAFRRKTLTSKDQLKSSNHNIFNETKEGEEGISTSSSSDSNGKQSKQKLKRKHQNEDDEECEDDGEDENEGPSTSKKRRIVWTEELKKKFNDVYYFLGPEKAVPKKILELMNVEGLSRGNVASHLQKFREQLKKGNIDQHKQRANIVVNLGRKDFRYMPRTIPTDEYGGRFSNVAPLSSYMPPQMVSRSNTPTGAVIDIGQSTPNNNCSTSNYPYRRLPDSSAQNQYPVGVHSLNPELFDNGLCRSSNFQDNNRCCEGWQGLLSTTLLRSEDSDFGLLPSNNLSTVSPSTPHIGNTQHDYSSIGALSTPNIWSEDDKQSYTHNCWDLSSIVSNNDVVDPRTRRSMDSSMFDQFNWEKTNIAHGVEVGNLHTAMDPNDGLAQYGVQSLDDQVCNSVMINQVEQENELDFLDKEIEFHDIQEQKKKDDSDFLDGGFGFHV